MNIDMKMYYGKIFRPTRLLRLFVCLGILLIYVTHFCFWLTITF